MVFPVVRYGYESWTIKKAESRRTDAFELWCWRRLLSPLDSKEIKAVSLKGNQPWILIQRTDTETEAPTFCSPDVNSWLSCNVPDAWKDWRQEKKASRIRWLDDITDAMDMNLGKLGRMGRDREAWHAAVRGVVKKWTQLRDWTTTQCKLRKLKNTSVDLIYQPKDLVLFDLPLTFTSKVFVRF